MSSQVFRILDANLNRSREALRVIEEYLRFVRDDARSTRRIKELRHRIKQIADALGPDKLLTARASQTDVGKDISSPSRQVKTDAKAIVTASCKRLQEALRNVEEYSNVVSGTASQVASELRFDAYQLEKDLLIINGPREAFEAVKLYVLIGSDLCALERIVPLSAELLDAGVDCLQLREKILPDRDTFELARELSDLCLSKRKVFIVNDRPDIAKAVGAGVHLGQDDLPIDAARGILPDGSIGLSTHNPPQLAEAIRQDPTYIAIGPAFATLTKPGEPPAGIDFVRDAVRKLDEAGIPHVAIGGISLQNVQQLLAAGVRRIAVASAILKADDPPAVVHKFAKMLNES